MTLDDYPKIPEGTDLASWELPQLRNMFAQFAALDDSYTDAFNDAFREFSAREAVYVKVFGKIAVLETVREEVLSTKPDALVTEGTDNLIKTLQALGIGAFITAGVKLIQLSDTLNDLRINTPILKNVKGIVKDEAGKLSGRGRGARQMVHRHNVDKAASLAKKQRALKIKTGLGAIALVSAGVVVYLQIKANKDLKADLVEALPLYEEWFETTIEQIDRLVAITDRMNTEIAEVVRSTGTGSEAALLSYLDTALGSAGQFKALFDSAVVMLNDGVTEEKVAEYTGLPLSYVQQIAGQT